MDIVVSIPWWRRGREIENDQDEVDDGGKKKSSEERPVVFSLRRRRDRRIAHKNDAIDKQ
jgi:hypothetical protein